MKGGRETANMTIRDVPVDVRMKFRAAAAQDGKTAREVLINLMIAYAQAGKEKT